MTLIRFALVFCIVAVISSPAQALDFVKSKSPTTATINKIYFMGDHYGYAVTSKGELLTSADGGATWKTRKLTKRAIRDIHILGRTGYLVGDKGLVMKSTDGGVTWKDMSRELKFNFTGVGVLNDTTAIICGMDKNSISKAKGILFQSYDNGRTWVKGRRWGNGYSDIVVNPPRKVFILGIKKVFHSIDAGRYFFTGKYEGARLTLGIDFMQDWGFMVGRKGYFARSDSHGRHWEEVKIGVSKDLFAVAMFDKYSGVAVGQDGLVVLFSNSGDNHTVQNCGENVDLKTVCVTKDRIICGGIGGSIFYAQRPPIKAAKIKKQPQKTKH